MTKTGKRIVTIVIVVVLALLIILPTLVTVIGTVFAATSAQLQDQLDDLESKADDIAGRKKQLEDELAKIDWQTESVSNQKIALDKQIEITNEEIENTMSQVQQYNMLISAKQKELDNAIDAQNRRTAEYSERIRTMEENGTISYISIILNASSFSELLDSLDMIQDLMRYDQDVIAVLSNAQKDIQSARESLEADKTALNEAKALLAEQETTLEVQQAEADELLLQLEDLHEQYTLEFNKVSAEEDEIRSSIAKKAAELQKTKEEEEAARRAALAARQDAGDYIEIDDSNFYWPVPGYYTITSEFGMRLHPILKVYKLHTGVDVGVGYGVPIQAAKSGWVITSEYSYAYGDYVVVSHGNGVCTLYAHMSSRNVSAGDYVLQGDTLGKVGSSGYSTGAHLHYEIQINGQYVNPLSYYSLSFSYS